MLDVALWGIQALRGVENCLPARVSGNAGIYWLDDAKEVPDAQVVTYGYGDLGLVWELRSFAKHHPIDGSEEGIGFHGSEASLMIHGEGHEGSWKVYYKDGSPRRRSHRAACMRGIFSIVSRVVSGPMRMWRSAGWPQRSAT